MRDVPRAVLTICLLSLGGCDCGGEDLGADGGGASDAAVSQDAASYDAAVADTATAADAASPDTSIAADASTADATVVADASAAADTSVADASDPNCPQPVTVSFIGSVQTVSGTPFGFDSNVRLAAVSGRFTYDLCVGDQTLSADRGEYDHAGEESGAFEFAVSGIEIRGSTRPVLEVENLSSDTFRFRDGPQFIDPTDRTMTVDSVAEPEVELFIAITDGSAAAFADDSLPAAFPLLDIASYPHTFSLSDADGTLLMQLTEMTQEPGN